MERGFYAPVHFDQLMVLDKWTPDGRRIESSGFGTRTLPRTIFLLDHQSEGGHLGAKIAGRLDSVEVGSDNVVSGDGLLLDDEVGRKAALYLDTKCITGNSVDLADTTAELTPFTPEGGGEERIGVSFKRANLGATTIVSMGAFPDATSSIGELAASMPAPGGMIHAAAFGAPTFKAEHPRLDTMYTTDVPIAWFVGEPGRRGAYPITVEGNGRIHGYLCDWEHAHLTAAGRVRAPRGNGYRHFNASTVLTPGGPAHTGPLVIGGDHADLSLKWTAARDRYAATSLAWADVHVSDDRYGIRINGMVRPGTPRDAVHAGRASRLSGDWRRIDNRMELIAALSVNANGFPVGRSFAADDGSTAALILIGQDSFAASAPTLAALRARIALTDASLN